MKNFLENLAIRFQNIWNKVPSTVQVIIYLVISGLLAALQNDLLEFTPDNPYLLVLQTGVNNLILYVLQLISKRVADKKQK